MKTPKITVTFCNGETMQLTERQYWPETKKDDKPGFHARLRKGKGKISYMRMGQHSVVIGPDDIAVDPNKEDKSPKPWEDNGEFAQSFKRDRLTQCQSVEEAFKDKEHPMKAAILAYIAEEREQWAKI